MCNVRIDEGSDGQRLDNFLVKLLKGVPKTHVYRVIRSGEVRVNKGRAGADTRLALGDEVRVPPVRVADRSRAPPAAPAREFPVVYEDERLLAIDKPAGVAVHGGSGVSFGVIEQLRRARPGAQFLELVHRLDQGDLRACCWSPRSAARWSRCRTSSASARPARPMRRWSIGAWPANAQGDRRAAAQVPRPADGERRVRAVAEDARRGRALDHAGARWRARFAGCTPARRDHQDRPHAPDPRPPGATTATRSSATTSTATSRSTRRWRVARGRAVRFERMFLHARRLRFTPPGERRDASSSTAPLAAQNARALLHALAAAPMTSARRFDLIAFDWDGTLFDSTALIARCIQAACADLGVAVPSDERRQPT